MMYGIHPYLSQIEIDYANWLILRIGKIELNKRL